jgi:hypothetical protein
VGVDLTLACAPIMPAPQQVYDEKTGTYQEVPVEPPQITQAPRIGTGLALIREDGSEIRFSDETRARPVLTAQSDPTRFDLTIRYQPQAPQQFLGRPLTEADTFVALSLNLRSIFAHHGILCDRIRTLSYHLNGAVVASAQDLPLDTGETRLELPAEFRTASTRAPVTGR